MPLEDYFDSNNQLGMSHVVPKRENEDIATNDGNASFMESSGSSISPKTEGSFDSSAIARSSQPNANFSSRNANSGPDSGTSSFISGTNIVSPRRVLTHINDFADIKPSLLPGQVLSQNNYNADTKPSLSHGRVLGQINDNADIKPSLSHGRVVSQINYNADIKPSLSHGRVLSQINDNQDIKPSLSPGRVLSQMNYNADIKPSLSPGRVVSQINGNADVKPSITLASPNTSSSGNINSSIVNGSAFPQRNILRGESSTQGRKRQSEPRMVSSVSQVGLASRVSKKPRIGSSPHSPVGRLRAQPLQEFQNCDPQLRGLIHHSRHHILLNYGVPYFLPDLSGVQCTPIVESLDQDFKRRVICPATRMTWAEEDVCSQRLAQYFSDMRNRPKENNIDFWRNFASEYYAPCAKERWCFSLYTNLGSRSRNILSRGITERLHCESCGSNSVKGFVASFELLPWFWKIKFGAGGVIDEFLHLGCPQEIGFLSGIKLLKYENVVQESVYDGIRVMHHGELRITFGKDLKIFSWEFCAKHHEEVVLCRSVQPEINPMVYAASNFRSASNNRATGQAAGGDTRANCNLFLSGRHPLERTIVEASNVNDLGFSKVYVRSFQIAEVVDMMKDLMAFSIRRNTAPIESLQTYVQETNLLQTQSGMTEEYQETWQEENSRRGLEDHTAATAINANMVFQDSAHGRMELGTGYNFNQTGSAMRPDELYMMNRSRQAMASQFLGHQYPNQEQSHDACFTNLARAVSLEVGQSSQHQSVWNAFGKQKEQVVVDTSGNIVPGVTITHGSTSMTRNGPNYSCPTSAIGQSNFSGNVSGNADNPWGISCSNAVNVQGRISTGREESGDPESHLPPACRGM